MTTTQKDSPHRQLIQGNVHLALYVLLLIAIAFAGIQLAQIHTQSPTISNTVSADAPQSLPVATTSPISSQSKTIDQHLTIDEMPRDVAFCGKIYRVKQVIIDGVDVVARIAAIIKEIEASGKENQLVTAICGNLELGIDPQLDAEGHLIPGELLIEESVLRGDLGTLQYVLGMGRLINFVIRYPSLEIAVSKAEEGGVIVIGSLK